MYGNKTGLREIGFERAWPYLILLIVAVAGYYQVSFMQHPLKWDAIDVFYPWRYFTGESLQKGLLPLWMPYQHLGYPIHADGSSGVWYPITWIIGFIGSYDIYAIHFEYILHIFIAGVGFFGLAKKFAPSSAVAFFCATAYMLSGFFTGNAQHLPYIVSGAWIPFVLSAYIDMYSDLDIKNALKTAFFTFLLFSGGYLAFLFVLIYMLLLIFIAVIIKLLASKDYKKLKRFVLLNALLLLFATLFCSVILVSLYQALPFLGRAEGFKVEEALFGPFSPQSIISFLLPFASVKDPLYFDTDISMSNAYIGIITAVFFLVSIFLKKPRLLLIIFIFSFLCLMASTGKYLPVRAFLFENVPLMNLFRFPAIFRLFFIIGSILMAGFAIELYIRNSFSRKFPFLLFVLILVLLLLFIIYSAFEANLEMKSILIPLFAVVEETTRLQHMAFQSILQIILVSLIIVVIYRIRKRDVQLKFLTFILISEMILAVQLNAPYTVFDENFKLNEIKEISNAFPKKFPLPGLTPVAENTDKSHQKGPFWRNTNSLHKRISFDGFNSFVLKDYITLTDSIPALFEATIQNNPVFIPGNLFPEKHAGEHSLNGVIEPEAVYVQGLSAMEIKTEETNPQVEILDFNPQYWKIKTSSSSEEFLVLMQTSYPGWKAQINSSPAEIRKVNFSLMGVFLPPGENIIEFNFSPDYVKLGFLVTALSLIFYFLFLLYPCFKTP